jgi:hypothetical protein
MPSKVAVVIPVYKQFIDLNPTEKISFEQSCKVLNAYEIFLVTHKEIDTEAYVPKKQKRVKIKSLFFDKRFFNDISGYNRLLLNYDFYKAFDAFQFLLICQLDAFVFTDELEKFVKKDYDYIGAPWFENFHEALEDSKIIGVGNGGFSLRKVSSFLTILNLFKVLEDPFKSLFNFAIIKVIWRHPTSFLRILKHELVRSKHTYLSILPWKFPSYEDQFWSTYVRQFFPWYKVSTIQDAISFSFEVNPKKLFPLNNYQLPMATHAWEKYNFDFWRPHIEKFGYSFRDHT